MDSFNSQQKSFRPLAAFTFIELILYLGLVAIFISGAVIWSWDLIYSQAKADHQRQVTANLQRASQRIGYEIRNASAINSVTATSLCLASTTASHNPTRFYLSSGQLRVAWGGGSANCTSMSNDQPLTESGVTVSSLTFSNRTTGSSKNIEFNLTITKSGARSEWQVQDSYASTVEVRSN